MSVSSEKRIRRAPGWEGTLDVFLQSRATARFSWGRHDCCLFACDAVLVMTGTDMARSFRDTYATALQAKRSLKQLGVETVGELADLFALRFGIREVAPAFAQRGDVVLLNRHLGESLGIVSLAGDEIAAPGEDKLAYLPFAEGRRAWRI